MGLHTFGLRGIQANRSSNSHWSQTSGLERKHDITPYAEDDKWSLNGTFELLTVRNLAEAITASTLPGKELQGVLGELDKVIGKKRGQMQEFEAARKFAE